MKKETEAAREWRLRQQRIASNLSGRLAGWSRQARVRHRGAHPGRRTTSIIRVPANLLAERPDQRDQIIAVLNSAIAVLQRPNTRVRFDFTSTAKLFPGGTLMLLAYLELLLQTWPGRVQARCAPHSLAAQLLRHFGIADQLGISPSTSTPRHESVVNWQYLTGSQADGSKIEELLTSYRKLTSAEIPEGLYDVLTEALINVRQHAYSSDGHIPEVLKRWWLFARYTEPSHSEPGNLYVGIYDIGVGIQTTMRRKLKAQEIVLDKADDWLSAMRVAQFGKVADRLLLKRAVEHRRSSTGLAHRGNGLPEMRAFVLATSGGRLNIVSGNAQYTCIPAKSFSEVITCNAGFLGTLILWSLPLLPAKESK